MKFVTCCSSILLKGQTRVLASTPTFEILTYRQHYPAQEYL